MLPPSPDSRLSRPQTYATSGSAKERTSLRSASGAHVQFASENATTSLSVWRTALSCAATLPPRGFRITRAPDASASSSVRSVDASEVTTSSSRSDG